MRNGTQGLTFVEVLVMICVLLILTAVILPSLGGSRRSPRIQCLNNLKQVGVAAWIWADDHGSRLATEVSTNDGGVMELAVSGDVLAVYGHLREIMPDPRRFHCPTDIKASASTNFETLTARNLSYFVSVDATLNLTNAFLLGDRHITNGTILRAGLLGLSSNAITGWTGQNHNGHGQLLWTDGHVSQETSRTLEAAVKNLTPQPTRVALPLSNTNPAEL